MPRLRLPITVIGSHGPVELVLQAATAVPWERAAPLVLRAAGLPSDTVLHHGIGPVEPSWLVGLPPLLAGCVLTTAPADDQPERPAVVLAVIAGPDAGRWLPMTQVPITVGRDPAADLPLTDAQASLRHALLQPTATGLSVADLGSTNGVFVDGAPVVGTAIAVTGSVIRIGGSLLQIQLTAEPPGGRTPDAAGHLIRSPAPPSPARPLPPLRSGPGPPPRRHRRSLPLVSVLLGAAAGAALALMLHSTVYLAFAALGPVVMLGSALSDRVSGRRSYRKELAAHRSAVTGWQKAAAEHMAAVREHAWRIWPDPATLLRRAVSGGLRLWERRPQDGTYLVLAIGSGSRPWPGGASSGFAEGAPAAFPGGTSAAVPGGASTAFPSSPSAAFPSGASAAVPGGASAAVADPDPERIAPPIRLVDVPMTMPLPAVLGLPGDVGRALARWLLLQLVCLHSPGNVALLLVGAALDLRPCRDLPHVPGGGPDVTSPGPASGTAVSGDLAAVGARDLVVILDGPSAIASPAGRALLTAAAGPDNEAPTGPVSPFPAAADFGAGVLTMAPPSTPRGTSSPPDGRGTRLRPRLSVLCLADDLADLPAGCVTPPLPGSGPRSGVLNAAAGFDVGACGRGRSSFAPVDFTGITADLLAEACRALTPVREGLPGTSAHAPGVLPLTDLVGRIDADALRRNWRDPRPRALLGAGPTGPVHIDLDVDGPHLLIAGTTGSGKSELLRTLVASLAIACPPQALTFLLVDYKGGSAFRAIAALPHVVGVVTDLDSTLSARALASLRAELRRRERLTAAGEPQPGRLVLVIDEFATLAAELPAFLSGVLDVAQRGRSLGLHLVLATQRPSGVVSPAMRANISARICLRVVDTADSLDVIGIRDAADLSPNTPGRAMLRTGAGLAAFQSALVSTALSPEIRVLPRDDPEPSDVAADRRAGETGSSRTGGDPEMADTANTSTPWSAPMEPGEPGVQGREASFGPKAPGIVAAAAVEPRARLTVFETIIHAAREAAAGLTTPRRPWVPPLPDRFLATAESSEALALADLPDEQCSRTLPLPDTSVLVTGPAGSGRTTAVRRIAAIAAERGCELLIVDAAGSLADLRDWPPVSSYLTLAEPHLVLRLLTLLTDPARRARDGRIRYLVIDDCDVVAAALDRADFATGSLPLTEIPTRTAGAVRLVASGPPSLVHRRVGSDFPVVIELGSDSTPSPPGRGRWSGTTVQIADSPPRSCDDAGSQTNRPSDDAGHQANERRAPVDPPPFEPENAQRDSRRQGAAAPHAAREQGLEPHIAQPNATRPRSAVASAAAPAAGVPPPASRQSSRWPDALVVRPIPRLVRITELPSPLPVAVPLGLGGDDARPLTLDLGGSGGAVVVTGPRRSGVSNALAVLGHGAARAGVPVIVVTTGSSGTDGSGLLHAAAPGAGGRYRVTTLDVRDGADPLRAALAAHSGPLVLIVDQCGSGAEHPAAELLDRFCRVCGRAQHLLVGERNDVLLRAHRGHLRSALSERRALLLQPDVGDGTPLGVTVPRRVEPPPPGRGLWVDAGTSTPVQVALLGPDPTSPVPPGPAPTIPAPIGPYPTGPYPTGPYPTGPYPTGRATGAQRTGWDSAPAAPTG